MKNAIATFITEHPFLSFLAFDALLAKSCTMVVTLVRGYPVKSEALLTVDDEAGTESEATE